MTEVILRQAQDRLVVMEAHLENSGTLGILKQLERGEIDANEADARLNAPPQIERDVEPRFDETDAPSWVRRLWSYLLVAGWLLVGMGAWIIVATVHANILWLVLGLPVVLLGAFVLAIAASARSGHWVYVNIKEAGRRRHSIRFGMTVAHFATATFPLGLIRFGLWVARWSGFRPRVRSRVNRHAANFNFDWSDADEFIDALERELVERRGVTVDVDDNDEHVQVFIV